MFLSLIIVLVGSFVSNNNYIMIENGSPIKIFHFRVAGFS